MRSFFLPFEGIDNLSGAGIRFCGMAQKVELKDIMIINYGKSVDIKSLPSTIIE